MACCHRLNVNSGSQTAAAAHLAELTEHQAQTVTSPVHLCLLAWTRHLIFAGCGTSSTAAQAAVAMGRTPGCLVEQQSCMRGYRAASCSLPLVQGASLTAVAAHLQGSST